MYEIVAAFLIGGALFAFPSHAIGFAKGVRSKYKPRRPRYRRAMPGPQRVGAPE